MWIDILSLFPEYFKGPFDVSILKRAIDAGLINIRHVDIREFSKDKHKKVDDRPFGGGPGMVLSAEPVADAIRSVKKEGSHVIYLSPQGRTLTAEKCKQLATYEHLVLLCGHYEGVDQRVLDKEVHEEISIGDYVLTNGCIPAIVLVDALARFIPEVLGNPQAALEDSFQGGMFEGPQYTRPDVFEGVAVPQVLKDGNHAEINKFKREEGLKKMKKVRPDLYFKHLLETKQNAVKSANLHEK
ncbi:MAG: tRNA (guanosine(37)-N1)-methyltransferase TrmD [Chlamydiae bacterium]|nr:tRNA (guanosine(37)-N1)-methyltransferase TrmD [Chlamydiota bacterium]